jgi:hypothetical protein
MVNLDDTYFVAVGRMGSPTWGKAALIKYDGSTTATRPDDLILDDGRGAYNSIAMLDATHVVAITTDNAYTLTIKIIEVDKTNDLLRVIDSIFLAEDAWYSEVIAISATQFAVAYAGPGDDGYVGIFQYDTATGWSYTINGISSFSKINGIATSAISKVNDV